MATVLLASNATSQQLPVVDLHCCQKQGGRHESISDKTQRIKLSQQSQQLPTSYKSGRLRRLLQLLHHTAPRGLPLPEPCNMSGASLAATCNTAALPETQPTAAIQIACLFPMQ
eukprot:jgi/Chlat1/4142/Chrsp27S04257